MSKTLKLYASKEQAINNGCKEDQIETKNGVFYCDCTCDRKLNEIKVEAEVVKPDSKKQYKSKK